MRASLLLITLLAVTACSSQRYPNIPVQTGLPPIGLTSQAIWLQERQTYVPRALSASDIATADICRVVENCTVVAGPAPQ